MIIDSDICSMQYTHTTKIAFKMSFRDSIQKFLLSWFGMELKDEISHAGEVSFYICGRTVIQQCCCEEDRATAQNLALNDTSGAVIDL